MFDRNTLAGLLYLEFKVCPLPEKHRTHKDIRCYLTCGTTAYWSAVVLKLVSLQIQLNPFHIVTTYYCILVVSNCHVGKAVIEILLHLKVTFM